jgi:hypothetical protein
MAPANKYLLNTNNQLAYDTFNQKQNHFIGRKALDLPTNNLLLSDQALNTNY